jgi:phosphatidate phosphatase LPIN
VFVNGKAIPFSMKIGEAGEAFFVFETDAEVPDDLITSPILEATRVGSTNTSADVQTGKFGSKGAGNTPDGSTQEPEYFDLDADEPEDQGRSDDVTTPTKTRGGRLLAESRSNSSGTINMLASVVEAAKPANLVKTGTSLGKSVVQAVIQTERENAERLKDEISAAQNIARNLSSGFRPANGDKGDEALPPVNNEEVRPNPVEYHSGNFHDYTNVTVLKCEPDVVIDMAGYHERGASERTITDSKEFGTPNSEPAGPGMFSMSQP